MKKRTLSIILGTLILFIWNAISWMVLPFHSNTLKNIPESALDARLLQEQLVEDGVYHYPGLPESPDQMSSIVDKLKEGPRITLMVYKQGSTELFDPKSFGLNLLFNILSVVILLSVVNKLNDKSLGKIIATTLSIGLIIAFMSDFPQMNWYMFPLEYTLTNVFDYLVSFGLIGLLFGFYTYRKGTSQ